MKRKATALILVFILLALMCVSTACKGSVPAAKRDLLILYTSDVHCAVDDGWGYAGLYAVKENLSKEYNVLLVDNGDAVQGEIIGLMTKGSAVTELMNTLGYDAAIPGNHEFDFGMDAFLELADKAEFPYISCNFNREGQLVFEPWILKETGGMKIAFVGVTTPSTLRSSTPRHFMDGEGNFVYGFLQDETGSALYLAVQSSVDAARAAGADYVIVLAHLGNEAESAPWTYADLISHVSGVDAVLDGHSHDADQVVMKDLEGHDVVRSACGTKFEHIGVLRITRDGEISSELMTWGSSVPAPELFGLNNAASKKAAELQAALGKELGRTVGKTKTPLYIYDPEARTDDGRRVRLVRNTETNLGNLVADAFLAAPGDPVIALVGGGGIREDLPKGTVTMEDVMTVSPFGNEVVVAEVSGRQLLDALEWSVHALPGEFGGFFQPAGVSFSYDPTIPSPCVTDENGFFLRVDDTMERRVYDVTVGDRPVDPDARYRVASTDYWLANSGDGYTMFEGAEVFYTGMTDFEVIAAYIRDVLGGTVGTEYAEPYGAGRMAAAIRVQAGE